MKITLDFDISLYGDLYETDNPKGIIQIQHGMAEHRARYKEFCEYLNKQGYNAFIYDQRGHGQTAGDVSKLGYMSDDDNIEVMLQDAKSVNTYLRKKYPELPIYLLGHSMGSFISQRYIELYSDTIAGVILSGSTLNKGILLSIGKIISKKEVKKHGRRYLSKKLNDLSFASFNKAIDKPRTEFDWLSVNSENVDKYINDPYCGTIFSASFFMDLLNMFTKIYKDFDKVRKDLPIYILSGDKDPVGALGKGTTKLYKKYIKCKQEDVTLKLYKDKRHEILNETNRQEVYDDLISWLNNKISK